MTPARTVRLFPDSGIVIGPILFIIAILGLLAAAITAASGSFFSKTDKENVKSKAQAIIQYAEQVKLAVDRVMANGCSDTEISFENPVENCPASNCYTNPNSPSDKSCHVFHPNGGGLNFLWPPQGTNRVRSDCLSVWPRGMPYRIGGYSRIPNLGTGIPNPNLILYLGISSAELCTELNRLLGISGIPPGEYCSWGSGACKGTPVFNGTYRPEHLSGYYLRPGTKAACIRGHYNCCNIKGLGIDYFFYYTLLIR